MNSQYSPVDLQCLRSDSQSLSFYADISAYLAKFIKEPICWSTLDVGSRTGSGTAFLRLAHHPLSYARIKLEPVHCIDLDSSLAQKYLDDFPDIEFTAGNIFDLSDKSYDFVFCSHTIEHISEPDAFVEKLISIASKFVLIAGPFEENDPLSIGHVHRITDLDLQKWGFENIAVYDSNQFHNGKCFLATKSLI